MRQVCDGGFDTFGIQREIVRSETSIPSLRSSPWMRGAPQSESARAIRSTNCRTFPTDRRAAWAPPPRLPSPVAPETLSMPTHDRVGLHEQEYVTPACPGAPEPDPEEPIRHAQARALPGVPKDVQLIAKSEVLEQKIGSRPDGRA